LPPSWPSWQLPLRVGTLHELLAASPKFYVTPVADAFGCELPVERNEQKLKFAL